MRSLLLATRERQKQDLQEMPQPPRIASEESSAAMECTVSPTIIRSMPLLLAAIVLLVACVTEPAPQEAHAISEFDVRRRPAPDARRQVEAILATGLGSSDTPFYSDITFFPVIHADAFDYGDAHSTLRRNDIEPDLSGVDFSSQFGFLVAHPSVSGSYSAMMSGQYAAYFSSVHVSYPEDWVVIHLSASRLGGLDHVTALTARWKGSIYPIERRGRSQVEVRIDEHAYLYSLDDGSLEATVSQTVH